MKKFLKFICALLIGALCVGFVSCSDDDDENDKPTGNNLIEKLQGKWTFEIMKLQAAGQTIEMNRDQIAQGSGFDNFYDDVLTFNGTKVNGLDYQINGNKILLPWYEDLGWWQSVSFSGNKMTLFLNVTYQDIPMKLWLTYVKNGSRAGFVPSSKASISILDAYMQSMN